MKAVRFNRLNCQIEPTGRFHRISHRTANIRLSKNQRNLAKSFRTQQKPILMPTFGFCSINACWFFFTTRFVYIRRIGFLDLSFTFWIKHSEAIKAALAFLSSSCCWSLNFFFPLCSLVGVFHLDDFGFGWWMSLIWHWVLVVFPFNSISVPRLRYNRDFIL